MKQNTNKINWDDPVEVENYLCELDEEMKDFDGGRKESKMDIKVGDEIFIIFTEDLEAEIDWGNDKVQMHDFKKGEHPMDPLIVAGIDEDLESVDFRLPFPYLMPAGDRNNFSGFIYNVPREYFSVIPF